MEMRDGYGGDGDADDGDMGEAIDSGVEDGDGDGDGDRNGYGMPYGMVFMTGCDDCAFLDPISHLRYDNPSSSL